jgi:hypothetical protein
LIILCVRDRAQWSAKANLAVALGSIIIGKNVKKYVFFQRGWAEELWMMNRMIRMVEDTVWRLTQRYNTTIYRVATKIEKFRKICMQEAKLSLNSCSGAKFEGKFIKFKKYFFLGFVFKYTFKKN